jgi:aspartate kinase
MLVMKFGGTSVGDANCFKQVVEIVKTAKEKDKDTVVVVSAMSGITNLLIDGAKAAAKGDHDRYPKIKADILNRHLDAVEKLNLDPRIKPDVCGLIEDRLHDFERLCRSVATLRELTARGLDVISSLGERLSTAMLAGALTTAGYKAQGIDADEIIVTDDNFGEATPLMEQTCAKVNERIKPLLARGIIPVVTGFMGAAAATIPERSWALVSARMKSRFGRMWTAS